MASPTPQDLTTQLQKAQDALNAKTGKKTQLPSITPTSSPVITSDTLKPQDKFSFPDTTPSTAVVGDLARIQSQTDDYTSNLKTASDTAKATETTSFQDYLNTKLNAPTREQLESTNYAKKGGVDDVQVELDNINSQIRAEQRALDVQLREIDKQAGGLQSGAQSEKSNLQRDSLQKQADLSVIQMAIQGRYDSARNIADRSINARISQDQKELDIRRDIYNRNSSLFTLAESRAFESAQADRQRALDKEALDLKTLSDTKLEAMKMAQMNGAPSSVLQAIQSATSPEQVISAGGQYAVTDMLDREAKRASIEASKSSTARNNAETASINAKNKAIADAIASGKVVLDEDQQKTAMSLGKQFEDESKTFKIQANAYNQILASADDASAAGDLSLIFGYMKMLDPNSVVRETEFANAENAGGIPERIRAQWNKAKEGERLTEGMRADFVDRAGKVYNSALDQQVDLEDTYSEQGTNVYGLPKEAVDLIIRDIRAQGAVSEAVFGLTLNNLSDAQILDLHQSGLLTTPSGI